MINVLKRNEKSGRTPSERLLAHLLIEHVSVTGYYAGQPLFDAGEYHAALTYFQVQATIRQEAGE